MNAFYLGGKKRAIDTINEPELRLMVFAVDSLFWNNACFCKCASKAFSHSSPVFRCKPR